jgi:hypothetical protein
MNLASDQSASNTPTVADFLPQLADTQSTLVENLESLRGVGCWRQSMRLGAVAGIDLRLICGRACLDAAFVSFMPR